MAGIGARDENGTIVPFLPIALVVILAFQVPVILLGSKLGLAVARNTN